MSSVKSNYGIKTARVNLNATKAPSHHYHSQSFIVKDTKPKMQQFPLHNRDNSFISYRQSKLEKLEGELQYLRSGRKSTFTDRQSHISKFQGININPEIIKSFISQQSIQSDKDKQMEIDSLRKDLAESRSKKNIQISEFKYFAEDLIGDAYADILEEPIGSFTYNND